MDNKTKFIVRNMISLLIWELLWFFIATFYLSTNFFTGSAMVVFTIIFPILWMIWIFDGYNTKERKDEWYDTNANRVALGIKPPFGKIAFIILLFIIGYVSLHLYDKYVVIYNPSVVYYKQYDQKTKEREGFFDNMWKTYYTKDRIVSLNKETFIEVTRLVMEARKDGSSVAWKWVRENQPVPYGEFTKFYSDLSSFIEMQRQGYYDLEKQCNAIATAHNMLIDTFPNNLYNRYLVHRKPIVYEYGFLSDSTRKVFKTGNETPN